MKKNDDSLLADVCVRNISVVFGTRPMGRTTDRRDRGRPSHGLLYMYSGQARFWTDDRQITVEQGELAVIPKHYRYKMQYSAATNIFFLVNFNLVSGAGEEISLWEDIAVVAKDDDTGRIYKIMTGLENSSISQNLRDVLRRKELLYRLLGIVFHPESAASGAQRYPQIAAGTRLLEQHYLENIPISALAQACNISVSSFRSLFTRQYGMGPVQYRNHLRIQRAAVLLADGSCTVTEAAYACGFENLGYFCRYYKRITGESPGQTRSRGDPTE